MAAIAGSVTWNIKNIVIILLSFLRHFPIYQTAQTHPVSYILYHHTCILLKVVNRNQMHFSSTTYKSLFDNEQIDLIANTQPSKFFIFQFYCICPHILLSCYKTHLCK